MIEKTLETIDGKLHIKIPSRLKEVTLGQLMLMQEKTDLNDLDAISILSGIPIDYLKNVCDFNDFDELGNVVLSLSNQIKHLYSSDVIPDKVNFNLNGKKVAVNVIRNLSVEPAGAFMAARDIIADEIKDHITKHGEEDWQQRFNPSLKANCAILAQYFYCRVTGKRYNEYEAEAFTDAVKQLGVLEALPVSRYFFMNYPNLSKPRTNYYQRLRQFWKRKQA
jgi:hypothetical protein